MKKLLTLAAGIAMLSGSVLAPSTSQAAIGIATGNAPLFVIGAVVTALNGGFVVSCSAGPGFRRCREGFYVGGLGGIAGLILMDAENQDASFAPLTAEKAAELGLNDAAKVDAYNHELAEINAVRESITLDTVARAEKGRVSGDTVHARWVEARNSGLISPEAFSVLETVSARAAQAVNSAAR